MDDRIVLVWDEIHPEGTTIFSSQSVDKGVSWTTPHRLSEVGKTATHPRIIAIENTPLIFWTEKQLHQPSNLVMKWLD